MKVDDPCEEANEPENDRSQRREPCQEWAAILRWPDPQPHEAPIISSHCAGQRDAKGKQQRGQLRQSALERAFLTFSVQFNEGRPAHVGQTVHLSPSKGNYTLRQKEGGHGEGPKKRTDDHALSH